MEELVTITVDGRELRVPKGTLLWEACQASGIDIPIFCYHTKLGPVGACRTCLVELEGARAPITACSTQVTDGMKVRSHSPVVEKAQRGIFEFLLLNHPLDCPICDRGGECPLQDQTFAYGPGVSRYVEPKRHWVKPIALGPTIALDRERCVLCWRCVRFCDEVAEDKSIILLDRGDHSVVGTFQDEPYVSNFSGNAIELCPVGALTSRKQRFNFRPWELQNRPSICPHCPMGCNINVSVRKNDEVIRFLSRDNPGVDDSWLCDRGRFNFEFINSPERLSAPLIRQNGSFMESSWEEALELIAGRLKPILTEGGGGPETVVGLASPRLTNEDLFVFRRFMSDVLGTQSFDHHPRPSMSLHGPQIEAMDRLGQSVMPIAALERVRTIVLLGADPSQREPVMELRIRKAINRSGARLLVFNPDEIVLSDKADRVMRYPAARFSEFVSALAAAITGEGAAEPPVDENESREITQEYLSEGPIALLYDDTFEGVEDKADAVLAVSRLLGALQARMEAGVIPMLDDCNSMGARDLGVLPSNGTGQLWGKPAVHELLGPDSQVRAAFILGSNVVRDSADESTARRLSQLDLLVVSELMMTETAKYADVVLPAASFAEKIGTFTNTERRVQVVSRCVPAPGVARPDWEMLVDLSQLFERPLNYDSPAAIWQDIRLEIPAYASIVPEEIEGSGALVRSLQPA